MTSFRPRARKDLHEAATLGVPATVIVDGIGTLDQSSEGGVSVAITLSVTFAAPSTTPAPTPDEIPDTGLPAGEMATGGSSLLRCCSLRVLTLMRASVFSRSQARPTRMQSPNDDTA